jgi:hypothetical protein
MNDNIIDDIVNENYKHIMAEVQKYQTAEMMEKQIKFILRNTYLEGKNDGRKEIMDLYTAAMPSRKTLNII